MDRRDFLRFLGGVTAVGLLAGCTSNEKGGETAIAPEGADYPGVTPINPGCTKTPVPAQPRSGQIMAVSRSRWGAETPRMAKMYPMNGVNRLTVHHEGNPAPNYDAGPYQVATSLRRIQSTHFRTLGAGDIGYHFVIDRQGTVWQGRELRYQGAHCRSNNEHNIGVMCLGNFNMQQPTRQQLDSLAKLTGVLTASYRIPGSRVYGHQELRSTACPGKNLIGYVRNIRGSLTQA